MAAALPSRPFTGIIYDAALSIVLMADGAASKISFCCGAESERGEGALFNEETWTSWKRFDVAFREEVLALINAYFESALPVPSSITVSEIPGVMSSLRDASSKLDSLLELLKQCPASDTVVVAYALLRKEQVKMTLYKLHITSLQRLRPGTIALPTSFGETYASIILKLLPYHVKRVHPKKDVFIIEVDRSRFVYKQAHLEEVELLARDVKIACEEGGHRHIVSPPFAVSFKTQLLPLPHTSESACSYITTCEKGGNIFEYGASAAESIRYLYDGIWGLKVLHDKGIIHGDFKPENILVALDDGEPPRGVLSDFEFADTDRALGSTIPYVQKLDKQQKEDDIWCIGSSLIALAFGKKMTEILYTHSADQKKVQKFLELLAKTHSKHISIRGIDSAALFSLLSKILQVDPTKRPSIDEVLDMPFFHPYR